jgi:hypothetical protein
MSERLIARMVRVSIPLFSHALFAASAAALVPACSSSRGVCTLELATSVTITVVDEAGAAQGDAKVTFSVNGGPERQAVCLPGQGAEAGCDLWTAGEEESGDFKIKATSGDGQKHAEASVTVEDDGCHVIGEKVTMTLKE